MHYSDRLHGRRADKPRSLQANWWARACAAFVLCAAAAIALPAQTLTILHSFDGTDGAYPYQAGLVQATDGSLYGTTSALGANNAGTVFKVAPSGSLTTLYSFCSQSRCTDGANPFAGLVQATDGSLYGTTANAGTNGYGGTVFKITPSGRLTTLYSFCSQSNCTDGEFPYAGLVQATDGSLYGTTTQGGASGYGTLFSITPSGMLTTIYSFCSQSNCTDGEVPYAGLVQGTSGNFYGTTYVGGAHGSGTVFRITATGTLMTLYDFCSQNGCTDGAYPEAALVRATDGNFYGTSLGGLYGFGTVFKITPSGTLTTLHNFCSQTSCSDGGSPYAPLIQATDGNLYGTTVDGGDGFGVIFEITPSGTLTTPHTFCSQDGCADGVNPFAALVQETNGKFYGTTEYGGANADGTVFSLSVGLDPFVETQPTSDKAGKFVKILGTALKSATSVTFNGTPAVFTVEGASLILTTVPAGATTGTVQVVTPGGTLSSNVPFRVLP